MHRRQYFGSWLFTLVLMVSGALPFKAWATPPEQIEINETFVDPFFELACGIIVEVHAEGTLIVRSDLDSEKIVGVKFMRTFTNVETGKSLTMRVSGLETFSSEISGGFLVLTHTFAGGSRLTTDDGNAINVGRTVETVVMDPETSDIVDYQIHVVGRDDSIDPAICAGLAE